jgi:hypothetical protein
VPGKTFLKHLKNRGHEFIPETGTAYQKSEKVQIKPANSDLEKIGLEWKSPCFILSGRSAAW